MCPSTNDPLATLVEVDVDMLADPVFRDEVRRLFVRTIGAVRADPAASPAAVPRLRESLAARLGSSKAADTLIMLFDEAEKSGGI